MRELVKKDVLLQWRQGFWLVYFIISIVYIIILLNIPRESRMIVSLIMILSDTTMLGIIFIAALILLEKQQSVVLSLFVTPLNPSGYIWAKTISLSLIAVTMSILVYLPVLQLSVYTLLLLFTIAITAAIFVLFGLGIASQVESINQYFGRIILISMAILIPVIPYLVFDRHPAFIILPYIASLDLMLGAMQPLSHWRIIVDIVLLVTWGYLAFLFSKNQVNKHLVYK
ncbi:MAG: hypothetical protein ABFS38_15010 [Bacteroidota bacterium]